MRRRLISLARRVGYDVVARDHYSPVLDPDALPARSFEQAESMPGLELDLDAQLAFVEQQLLPLAAQLAVPLKGTALHLDNGWYGPLDAHVLYALLRRRPPRRVVELGSGYSTLFIERALDDAGVTRREHHVIDPYPSPLLAPVRQRLRVLPISGAQTPQALFDALQAD